MTLLSSCICFAILYFLVRVLRTGMRQHRLPPGPPTWPVIGNLGSMISESTHIMQVEWFQHEFVSECRERLTKWAREYGPIYSLKLGDRTAIVLTSAQAINELIDKRSGNTVDRPYLHVPDIITDGNNLAITRYGPKWRLLRKTIHTILTPQAVQLHIPIQTAEAAQLLYDILECPKDFYTHIRRYTNSVIMSILFGKRSPRYETPHTIEYFEESALWNEALAPGSQPPVDLFPILKYVPERWARWKYLAREIRARQRRLYFGLVDECEERMKLGIENGCYMEEILRSQEILGLNRELTGYVGAVFLEAASDTTATMLQSLPLMLVAFPEVQKKAQEEIDRVVGDRLPSLEDIESLTYIQCVVRELHRFRPAFPLALPHATLENDEYNGYLIPKETTIFLNTWGLFHDPDVFENPETFWPERFLLTEHGTKPGVDDSYFRSTLPFGGGRRICPGIHLANNSLHLNAMNLIWAFNFTQSSNSDGTPCPVDIWNYEEGISYVPRPYKCKITVRSPVKEELIRSGFAAARGTFRLFEYGLEDAAKA